MIEVIPREGSVFFSKCERRSMQFSELNFREDQYCFSSFKFDHLVGCRLECVSLSYVYHYSVHIG